MNVRINRTSSIEPTEVKPVASDNNANFQGKEVSVSVDQGTTIDSESCRQLNVNKSIQERSAAFSSDDLLYADSNSQNDTNSFYSATTSVDDKFLDEDKFSIEKDSTPPQPTQAHTTATQQTTTVDQETVDHLVDADKQRLNEYIDNFTKVYESSLGTSGIAVDIKEQLKDLVTYNENLDADMQRLNELAQKFQRRGLSAPESIEMKALMHCHKYNLAHVQSWLSATQAVTVDKGAMNEPTATLFMALSHRFALRHIHLADMMSLYEDRLPNKEPISRNDRAGYNLLTAHAGLRTFKIMTLSQQHTNPQAFAKMQAIYPSLVRHCKALRHAAQLANGQIKTDATNPQLQLESLDAWTDNFDVAGNRKDPAALPPQLQAQLNSWWEEDPPTLPLSHPHLSQRDMTELFIAHQLKRTGVDSASLPKFGTVYEQALITEINHGEWPVIDKSLQFEAGGKTHTCRSQITPGAHLAKRFPQPYQSNGVAYMDRLQTEHAPNMAHTQLLSENGEVLFSGIRHGIIDSYNYNDARVRKLPDAQITKMAEAIYNNRQKNVNGITTDKLKQRLESLADAGAEKAGERRMLETQLKLTDEHIQGIVTEIKTDPAKRKYYIEKMRVLTAHKMAHELLSATIVSDPVKLEAALNGETVNVTLNSVALVTPDLLRARYMTGGPKDEQLMLKHQVDALRSLDSHHTPLSPTRLMIADENGQLKEIKVHVRVRAFNFGVNEYALAKTVLPANLPIWRNLMGWGFSSALNNPQLQELLGPSRDRELGGDVAIKLQKLEQSADPEVTKQATLLREAATQAKRIWRQRSFWSGNNEPYKMVSRLALISHLMDETTLFNCKSGKDRTGQLDAEAKYLAAVGHASGHIPEPDAAHTDASRKMRTTFTLDAGNMELQRMNTGLPGYKLRNIPGLEAMLDEGTKEVYEGGSDFV